MSGLWRWSASASPQKFLPLLNSNDRQIYEDHSTLPCKHLVVWSGDDYCYLVHSKTEGPRGFSSSFVHYISDLSVFRQAIEKIKLVLLFSNRAPFVTIERRMLRGPYLPVLKRGAAQKSAAVLVKNFKSRANRQLVFGNDFA